MSNFGFEIDFLPVGEKSKSGDAICVRWGYDLLGEKPNQFVMVIDGGFAETGDVIINHIKHYYKSGVVDFMVSTHPHADHIGGLEKVLIELDVKNFALHRPWLYDNLLKFFKDGRVTDQSIKTSLKVGLEGVYKLECLAKQKNVQILDPFSSLELKEIKGIYLDVLGPSELYYKSLVPSFNVTPTDGEKEGHRLIPTGDMVDAETGKLTDDGQTSAENNSGVILCFTLPNGELVLLTGDAGMPALWRAVDVAKKRRIDLINKLVFLQVPHHGSVQNIGPSILDEMFRASEDFSGKKVTAYISVSKNPKDGHPARCVINALQERNVCVCETRGSSIRWKTGDVPSRDGWIPLEGIAHFDKVEEFVIQ